MTWQVAGLLLFEQKTVFLCQEMQIKKMSLILTSQTPLEHSPGNGDQSCQV